MARERDRGEKYLSLLNDSRRDVCLPGWLRGSLLRAADMDR